MGPARLSGRRKVAAPRRRAASREGVAYYVYCIGELKALSPLSDDALPDAIEPGSRIELINEGRLAAVVCRVSMADYSEDALQTKLEDPAWTAARALRHERAVSHFAARAAVVPLRFGAIYLGRERIRSLLKEKRRELLATIDRLRNREEWGVSLLCDRSKFLESLPSVSTRLRDLSHRARSVPPGQSYLLRKKIDGVRAAEAAAHTRHVIRRIESDLKAASEGAVRLRVTKAEIAEQAGVAAKLAFLVPRQGFDAFISAAELLAAEYAELGFRLELTGPWPPYNFAAGEQ
jgi:hypothetical protein